MCSLVQFRFRRALDNLICYLLLLGVSREKICTGEIKTVFEPFHAEKNQSFSYPNKINGFGICLSFCSIAMRRKKPRSAINNINWYKNVGDADRLVRISRCRNALIQNVAKRFVAEYGQFEIVRTDLGKHFSSC